MRKLFKLPRGFNADGRMLGLGLAAALDKQREQAARSAIDTAEDYLRRNAREDDRHTPAAR